MAEAATRRRRGGGRAGNAERRGGAVIEQMPWRIPVNVDRPTEPLSDEGVEAVHDGAMRILEEIGIEFLNPEAIEILREAGCTIEGENVRMGRDFVMEMVGKAPSTFEIAARNPAHNLTIGGKNIVFGNVSSPPNYFDLEIGKKVSGNREQCANLLKLTQYFNCIHFAGGYPVEPVDIHASVRHLDVLYDKLTLTDKVMHAYSLGKERVEDVMEMVKIANGLTEEEFAQKPYMYTNINSTSPLKHDFPMIDGCLRLIRRGQAVVVTPFTLSGAMSPVTLAGALAQQNAEALGGIVLAQCVRAGAPVIYGGFTTNVDMRTGSPAFGTPEYTQAAQITGQLARRYNLPFRSSNTTGAHLCDAQAAYESQMSLWGAVMGGASIVKHAAGWLGGGLVASFEKLIIDAEMLQMMAHYLEPPAIDTASLGVEAIASVGHGGHFFGEEHTLSRYKTAFYEPLVSDWDNYENWVEKGSLSAADRANATWKRLLKEYQEPPLDPAIHEAVTDYAERRKREIDAGVNRPDD